MALHRSVRPSGSTRAVGLLVISLCGGDQQISQTLLCYQNISPIRDLKGRLAQPSLFADKEAK